jgi:hypothetical protein
MPRRVADLYPWHSSAATSALGQASIPGALNGSCGQVPLGSLTPPRPWIISGLPKRRTRETGLATVPPVSFVRKSTRPTGVPERLHNLGTTLALEPPPQRQVHRKTGAPTPVRGSRLSFEWIVPGLTVVCFWSALRRLIAALEGPVRFGLARAAHWPD